MAIDWTGYVSGNQRSDRISKCCQLLSCQTFWYHIRNWTTRRLVYNASWSKVNFVFEKQTEMFVIVDRSHWMTCSDFRQIFVRIHKAKENFRWNILDTVQSDQIYRVKSFNSTKKVSKTLNNNNNNNINNDEEINVLTTSKAREKFSINLIVHFSFCSFVCVVFFF